MAPELIVPSLQPRCEGSGNDKENSHCYDRYSRKACLNSKLRRSRLGPNKLEAVVFHLLAASLYDLDAHQGYACNYDENAHQDCNVAPVHLGHPLTTDNYSPRV